MPTIEDVFHVEYGNQLDMNKQIPDPNGVCFVGRKGNNQGISGRVREIPGVKKYPAGALTVALGGSRLLATFVQQEPFYTAQNVAVLTPRDANMPLSERLFYAMAITANRYRYTAFGREANRTIRTIELPAKVPSWVSSAVVESLSHMEDSADDPIELTPPETWGTYRVDELFTVHKGDYVKGSGKTVGNIPRITSTASNNGQSGLCGMTPNAEAGSISVARNGSVGEAFYQPTRYFATDDVHVFTPLPEVGPITAGAALFVCTIIRLEKYRYNYGRKWSLDKMRATEIRLPQREDGTPDWDYMTRYVHGLPFSSVLADEPGNSEDETEPAQRG
ncbi:restriction endonuclease subunit S [Mycobacteroides abscessus]|uniref:restriction endonuclease subunit S n=1 Tax=Mycobacteroides abscessus TaxID=36809 RepID=UPI0007F9510A|nr:restriction endonuclease subunit S [Mycobacteroides abscessus]ANO12766.1 hypothetical protein BAB77_01895 [Mycobacteroides abscessus]ARQ63018.1 hypothetical protein CAK77_02075 [Mycobacteroides abscessus subsp. massiliense]MBE5447569.1 hypothetical protein [Mycobacteroides abscessus]MBE5514190.1 hypothetical protein [Mycobacteroides abscessus]MBN7511811.1 restriction endonuclease subunit S [Mycobacteroides abscessus subsp. massiliense]